MRGFTSTPSTSTPCAARVEAVGRPMYPRPITQTLRISTDCSCESLLGLTAFQLGMVAPYSAGAPRHAGCRRVSRRDRIPSCKSRKDYTPLKLGSRESVYLHGKAMGV